MRDDSLTWGPVGYGDIKQLGWLARRVLAADGGRRWTTDRATLGWNYDGPRSVAIGARTPTGRLVAAVSARAQDGARVVTGMVDPPTRGRGLGAAMLDWALGIPGAASADAIRDAIRGTVGARSGISRSPGDRWSWRSSRSPTGRRRCSPAAACGRSWPRTCCGAT